MLSSQDASTLWNLIEPIRIAMLTTWNGSTLNARPMAHVNDEFNGIIYFFSEVSSEKIKEIEQYPEIGLTYADEERSRYVSIAGEVEITRDRHLIDKYWNSMVAAWFPNGKDSQDICLLKVHCLHAEYWDNPSSKMVQLFKIAKANLTDTRPDMGNNRKLG